MSGVAASLRGPDTRDCSLHLFYLQFEFGFVIGYFPFSFVFKKTKLLN